MQKEVPLSALRFSVGEFAIGDNGESASSAPVRLLARSNKPIDHWYFGRVVHDIDGMQHKSRIALDYNHNDNEIIGYANKFEKTEAGLEISGALVPKASARATEVVQLMKAGVPYEASIYFTDYVLERVEEGFSAPVNGEQFEGPGYIVRSCQLRGCAVCPHGYDPHTETTSLSQQKAVVTYLESEKMTEQTAPAVETEAVVEEVATQATESVTEQVVEAATAESDTEATETEKVVEVAAEEVAAEPTAAAPVESATALSEGQKFLTAFGDQGGVWFAQGKSFAEAQTLFTQSLLAEKTELAKKVEELQTQLAATRGEPTPVSFQAAGDGMGDGPKQPTAQQREALGENLSKFAANITFVGPKKK